jgi:hypothetical protein
MAQIRVRCALRDQELRLTGWKLLVSSCIKIALNLSWLKRGIDIKLRCAMISALNVSLRVEGI